MKKILCLLSFAYCLLVKADAQEPTKPFNYAIDVRGTIHARSALKIGLVDSIAYTMPSQRGDSGLVLISFGGGVVQWGAPVSGTITTNAHFTAATQFDSLVLVNPGSYIPATSRGLVIDTGTGLIGTGCGCNVVSDFGIDTNDIWHKHGDAGTDGSQSIGTTDAQPLNLKTNNTQRSSISATGDFMDNFHEQYIITSNVVDGAQFGVQLGNSVNLNFASGTGDPAGLVQFSLNNNKSTSIGSDADDHLSIVTGTTQLSDATSMHSITTNYNGVRWNISTSNDTIEFNNTPLQILDGTQSQGRVYSCDNYGNGSWQEVDSILPYRKYVALIHDNGDGTFGNTVIENNIGNIVWSRNAIGDFSGTLSGAFTSAKTICFTNADADDDYTQPFTSNAQRVDNNTVGLFVGVQGTGGVNNSITSIEIRVYK